MDGTGSDQGNQLNHKWNSGEAFVRGIKEGLGIREKERKVGRGEGGFESSIVG
jgi:hypothetical protein